ncbi:MAG: hypothetical protein HY561_00825, partial [Gemmatimonadetes bacterium]|nr:hypothetical protein [Gemmatimonadota bacterium]
NLSTLSLRAVASKGILFLDFAVGAGYDKYSSDLSFDWQLRCQTNSCRAATGGTSDLILRPSKDGITAAPVEGELETAAWNVFGDVALNFLMLNIVGELGYQKSTDVIGLDELRAANLKDQDLTKEDLKGGRFFGSFGVRIQL